MDYKFLNKVVDQIVRETEIDYDMEEIQFPFSNLSVLLFLSFSSRSFIFRLFTKHCRDVYGLNEEETMYVWKEYREIIKDKIKNNG
tara:strand:+ start:273 stop:530 length:258 start_codon:yes stop_codon:yes gene_type:complete